MPNTYGTMDSGLQGVAEDIVTPDHMPNTTNGSQHIAIEQNLNHSTNSQASHGDMIPLQFEDQEHRSADESRNEQRHFLGVLPLAMIVFYNVSGGPFGIEESVRSAGFFATILGFLVMPFVWSLQEALVTAELGSAFPEASGGVAWVEEAFGSAAGWQAGFLGWTAGATDNAIYPVLFLNYVFQLSKSSSNTEVNPILRWSLLSLTTTLLGYLNWLGLEVVGNMSILIGIFSMSPFVVMIAFGVFQLDPSRWFLIAQSASNDEDSQSPSLFQALFSSAILWRPLLNNLFWNLNSFDAAASYAADVRDPGYVLPRSLVLGLLFTVIGYLLPLLIAIGATDSQPVDWVDGYLTTVATTIGGEWLGAWVVLAAGVSNIALFQAELSADAFQVMGMAERGFLPKIFATRSRHDTPTYGIALGVGVIIAMGSFNLESLIEMLNFNYSISLLMEYAAFLKLRVSKPNGKGTKAPMSVGGCKNRKSSQGACPSV